MQYRRARIRGGTYFFTVNLQDRSSALLTTHITELRAAFRKVQLRHQFKIDAIVVLPEHLHAVFTLPPNDENYSQRWNLIKGYFSKKIELGEDIDKTRKIKRERGIWQRRFWEHLIRDDSDYAHHINYIHFNPVKHGYVLMPSDWPFSSIHRFIDQGILPLNWGGKEDLHLGKWGERD